MNAPGQPVFRRGDVGDGRVADRGEQARARVIDALVDPPRRHHCTFKRVEIAGGVVGRPAGLRRREPGCTRACRARCQTSSMPRRAAAREVLAWAALANIIALRPSDRLGRVPASSIEREQAGGARDQRQPPLSDGPPAQQPVVRDILRTGRSSAGSLADARGASGSVADECRAIPLRASERSSEFRHGSARARSRCVSTHTPFSTTPEPAELADGLARCATPQICGD